MRYHTLDQLVARIKGPQGAICRRILDDNRERFQQAPGSSHNHQAWPGGYLGHITEAMNLCVQLYGMLKRTGWLTLLPVHEQFTLSDGLLVLFLHDLEKPWRHYWQDGQLRIRDQLRTKPARTAFVVAKLAEYGLQLTPVQANALHYVEGIRDADYSPGDRVMRPLGALVHCCDLLSARLFYDFPRSANDPWSRS